MKWIHVTGIGANWKFFCDNFNESYHTRTAHPQVPPSIDQDHFTSRYEIYPMGHGRIIQRGAPSLRDRMPANMVHPFDARLREWEIDPDSYPDFETKVQQGLLDMVEAKKRLWKERGRYQYEHLSDEDLMGFAFAFVFPNIAFSISADILVMHRWEPHPTDPEKCSYDMWTLVYPTTGDIKANGGQVYKAKEANYETFEYDGGRGRIDIADQVTYQDMGLAAGQQEAWHSKGYRDPYLAGQETRVRRFHEVLNDYIAGDPPRPTNT